MNEVKTKIKIINKIDVTNPTIKVNRELQSNEVFQDNNWKNFLILIEPKIGSVGKRLQKYNVDCNIAGAGMDFDRNK